MNTKLVFQQVSKKMKADFDASAEILHSGSKGTVRENILRDFLASRLPFKYGLGKGEIIGRVRDTSQQCDLIVFDKLNGVHLFNDENVQIFPVDCVYGLIEVKSSLSKTELIDSLEKIKTLKSMKPSDNVVHKIGSMTTAAPRSSPFGMVFAYKLSGNSLHSLRENLMEWEKINPPEHWPNYICILETGIIFHHSTIDVFKRSYDSDMITKDCNPVNLEHVTCSPQTEAV